MSFWQRITNPFRPRPSPQPTPSPSPSRPVTSEEAARAVDVGASLPPSAGRVVDVSPTSSGGIAVTTTTGTTSRPTTTTGSTRTTTYGGGGSSPTTVTSTTTSSGSSKPSTLTTTTQPSTQTNDIQRLSPGQSAVTSSKTPAQDSPLISGWQATKSAGSSFAQNVGLTFQSAFNFGRGKDMSYSKIWSGTRNPLKPFEYATRLEATREISNPFYVPSTERMTTTTTPDITQKKFITKQELYESPIVEYSTVETPEETKYITTTTPRISESEVYGRRFSAPKTSQILGTGAKIGATIVSPNVGTVIFMSEFTKAAGRSFNPNISTQERVINIGVAGLSLSGVGFGVSRSIAQLSAQQRAIAVETVVSKAGRTKSLGTREFIGEGLTKDVYGKIVKTDSARLELGAEVFTKTSSKGLTTSYGFTTSKLRVTDYWSGQTFGAGQVKSFIGRPSLFAPVQQGGATPSITPIFERTLVSYQYTPSKISTNIFPPGGYDQRFVGGRAIQRGEFIYGQSGSLKKFTAKVIETDVGRGYILTEPKLGFRFTKEPLTILKIKGTTTSGGFTEGLSSGKGFTGTGSGTTTVQSSIKAPIINVKPSTQMITEVTKSSGFIAPSVGTLTSSQVVKSFSETKQKPVVSTSSFIRPSMKQDFITGVKVKPITDTIQSSGVDVITTPSTRITPRQDLISFPGTSTPTPTSPYTGVITPTPPPPPFLWLPKLPFGGERGLGLKDLKVTRRYKYTPSFKALAFNIRGKAPKKGKRFTGLETRPITKKGGIFSLRKFKGFSFG